MGRKLSPQEAAAIGISFSPEEIEASRKEVPKVQVAREQEDPRSFGGKLVDSVSDALPVTGALVGGAVATPFATAAALPSMGASALAIPAAGAAGYSGGELLKRFLDKVSGRAGTPAPVNVPSSAMRGAAEGMNAFSGGQMFGRVAQELKEAPSLASEIGPAGNPFANLGDKAFRSVHSVANLPAKPIMAAPEGELAELGGKFASQRSAQAANRGAERLKWLESPLAQDAELGRLGTQGRNLANAAQGQLEVNDPALGDAKAQFLDEIRKITRPVSVLGEHGPGGVGWSSPQDPMARAPLGEKLANKAFNEPDAVNAMIESGGADARAKAIPLKTLGAEQPVLGELRKEGFSDAFKAHAQGIGSQAAEQAGSDAAELRALSRTMLRQRGGIQQTGPSALIPATAYYAHKAVAGPRSTMMGFRPETPESALQNNTIRLAELEAEKRGMPALNPEARAYASTPQTRPTPAAIASPNGRAIGGADMEVLRQFLASLGDNKQ